MNTNILINKTAYEERKGSIIPVNITCSYLDAYISSLDSSPLLREAHALKALWSVATLQLYEYEIIAGRLLFREPVFFNYGCGTVVDENIALEYIEQEKLDKESGAELLRKLEAVKGARYVGGARDILSERELASVDVAAATSTYFGGHMVMNHEHILRVGLDGIEDEINLHKSAAPAEKLDFYEAMSTTLFAVRTLILRYADRCGQASEQYGTEKARFAEMSGDIRAIAHNPPVSFRQALQLCWFIHMVSDYDSFGRFDQYLYPFLKKDLDNGSIDLQAALELIEGLWIKVDEEGSIQNMTIGGTDKDGKPAYNELTMLCLEATRELEYKGPNLCLRVSENMPQDFWEATLSSIGTGTGLPALYNERIYIDFLKGMGVPEHDARDFCLAGCSQTMIPGKSSFVNDIGLINIIKCLEITYNNGTDPRTGIMAGLQTGEVSGFATFDEFLDAFKQQLKYFCALEADINNKDILFRREREGYAIRALFTHNCIEKGQGVYHGGALYNNVELECIGITNAADSLMAIKRAVFDDKTISFVQLVEVLKSDFEDNEALRQCLRNKIPKFGNDDREVDEIRRDITSFIYDEMRAQEGVFGGHYIPGEVIFVVQDWMGSLTGATPDGRKAGQVLADSVGASQGLDKKGPTALLNSVLSIPTDKPLTTPVLNIKFMKSLWNKEGTRVKIQGMFKSFFERGGMQLQINVCDAKVLRDAVDNPQDYQSLVVRVGGYSAYFTTLSRTLQEDIISRTAY
ncbi:MAG: pyruvate formate lyase family protein [Eubacteriales bacterium]